MTGEHKEIIRDSEEWKDSSMDKCLAEMAKGGMMKQLDISKIF